MANIKISELNELEQVDNDDLLVIVDTSANETKKVKARNVGTGGGGSDVVIISDTQPTSEDNKIWIDTGEVGESFTEITNEYSTSTGKGYSADYINKLNTYSTTEQRIGTWIDGKPLYRKVISKNQNIQNDTEFSSGILNIDKCIKIEGTYNSSDDTAITPHPSYAGTTNYLRFSLVNKTNGTLKVQSGFSSTNNRNIIITLEYTKTTD